MSTQMTLGQKLRSLRMDSHLSQKDLAKFIGISSRQIRRFESGKTLPSQKTLRSYAKTFGVNTIDLLDERFEFGSKQLFQTLRPYVEQHLSVTSKQIYTTGQAILKLKQRSCGGPWGAEQIKRLEDELEEQLIYFRKASADWEQAHYM